MTGFGTGSSLREGVPLPQAGPPGAAEGPGVSEPYPWPYDAPLDPTRLTLVIAGAQRSWAEATTDADALVPLIGATADAVRRAGGSVVRLRHIAPGAPSRKGRSRPSEDRPSPVEDPGVAGLGVDPLIEATGIDGFSGSGLEDFLRSRGSTHLALAGFGLEGPVHSTLRSANDRGYECLVLTDACSPVDERLRAPAISTVTMSGGIFGDVAPTTYLLSLLSEPQRTEEPQ